MKRFILIFSILAFISSGLIAGVTYWRTRDRVLDDAATRAVQLQKYLAASASFFQDYQKSAIMELMEKDRFYPELSLEYLVSRVTWEIYEKKNPDSGLDFRQAALDPVNRKNFANEFEKKIINNFADNPSLPKQVGVMSTPEGKAYYLASPVRVWNKKCLECHGDPNDAPRFQTEIYGTDHGYNWEVDDVVAAKIVYVSLDRELERARNDALIVFAASLICFFLSMGLIIYFLGND